MLIFKNRNLGKYRSNYNRASFWKKIKSLPKKARLQFLDDVLTLFVLLYESSSPRWAKFSITCCLGYFVCPTDLIPDFLPGGLLDDLTAITLLLAELRSSITPSIKRRVQSLRPNS